MFKLSDQVAEATRFIQRQQAIRPAFGIILGTGSGILASEILTHTSLDYQDIPHFPHSTALGHKGQLLLGAFDQTSVVAMDGRFHLYEGHSIDQATIGIRVMRELGVTHLLITNASGGLNPQYKSGDLMIIRSHIDLMCRTSSQSSSDVSHQRRLTCSDDAYCSVLDSMAHRCARHEDFNLHSGVYAGLLGPNYETRAEYRMLRRIGADVAGMSTIPEVYVANLLGIRVIGLSIVTNIAKPDVLEKTSGQEVIDAAETAAPKIKEIFKYITKTSDRTPTG
ncbi:MAG: purine-nucleoside phosphorylase [Planctomycetota bacterium]